MTLLLRELGRFLLDTVLWVGLAGVVAVVVASSLERKLASPPAIIVAGAGGAVLAGMAARIGLPMAWAPAIGGRVLPIGWVVLGAVTATLLRQRLATSRDTETPAR